MMKNWRLFLAVLFCSGLGIGFGLSGCGDDDDGDGGNGMTTACQEALTEVNSQDCQDDATGAMDGYKSCREGCEGNEVCEEGCDAVLRDEVLNCLPGLLLLKLIDNWDVIGGCGDCYPPCGDNFEICIDDTPTSGTDCWEAMMSCINDCA
jgi:hypothetical protein